MLRSVLQNSTAGFYIFASDSTVATTGKTGLTITATLSKSGGIASSVSPTITEIGNGVYWIAPIAAHRDTLGEIAWQFSATNAIIAPRFEKVVAVNDQVARFGAANASDVWSALTTTNYGTNSFGNQVLIGSTANRSVLITGSNHAAADVHEFQPDVIDADALAASAVSEIQSGLATLANQVIIIDGIGYTLAQVQGSVSSPQTSTPAYVTLFNGSTYTVTHTGVTSTGVRGTATRSKT